MSTCRIIFDSTASGAHNMAVDETILHAAARDQLSTLRFYSWQPATLSLGYFPATR